MNIDTFFQLVFDKVYACFMMVHTRTDKLGSKLLPQLLMEQFDTLPSQYRHNGPICVKKLDAEKIRSVKLAAMVNLDKFSCMF